MDGRASGSPRPSSPRRRVRPATSAPGSTRRPGRATVLGPFRTSPSWIHRHRGHLGLHAHRQPVRFGDGRGRGARGRGRNDRGQAPRRRARGVHRGAIPYGGGDPSGGPGPPPRCRRWAGTTPVRAPAAARTVPRVQAPAPTRPVPRTVVESRAVPVAGWTRTSSAPDRHGGSCRPDAVRPGAGRARSRTTARTVASTGSSTAATGWRESNTHEARRGLGRRTVGGTGGAASPAPERVGQHPGDRASRSRRCRGPLAAFPHGCGVCAVLQPTAAAARLRLGRAPPCRTAHTRAGNRGAGSNPGGRQGPAG